LPQGVPLTTWRAPIWDATKYREPNFLAFRKRRGAPLPTIPEPQAQAAAPDLPVAQGDIPGVSALRQQLASALDVRVGGAQPPRANVVAITQPDADFLGEKGWVYDELAGIVTGGESEYLEALQAYVQGRGSSSHLQALRRVVAQLEKVPGNEQGAF
jgi:hypothetical protein